MAAAAEPGARTWPGSGSPRLGSPAGSPVLGISGRTRPGSGPERTSRAIGSAAPGHSFRKVTLTKPTFCHLCSDFIWGLAGFLCDVCNFMSHEKCLKQVKTPCTSIAPSLVRVPVAHCFGSLGLYKRKFCVVCRKSLEVPAFRCEATVVSATRMDSRIMTRITTTGGRGTCLLVHDVRSVGRLVVPQMCWLVYAASGVVYRLTQCAPQHLRLSVHLDVYAPWYCLLRVCACCPETSARCTVSESLRPWSWSLLVPEKTGPSGNALDLFRHPHLRKVTLILIAVWFVDSLVYYSLSFQVGDFGLDIYVTQLIFGAVEMPGRFLSVLMMEKLGRKWSQLCTLTLAGIMYIIIIFIPGDLPTVVTVLAVVGKFASAAAFTISYVYTAELFPTIIRQTGMGLVSMFSRVGGIITPLVMLLEQYHQAIPMVIFGSLPIGAGLLCALLPESRGQTLKDTLQDLEQGLPAGSHKTAPQRQDMEASGRTSSVRVAVVKSSYF